MAYTTEWENKGICWKYAGVVTGKELIRSNLDIYGDARFDNMRYQIVDLTDVEGIKVSAEDMKRIAAYDEAASLSNPYVKVAVVATSESAKALSIFYDNESSESPWETMLFDTVNEARFWINS